MNMNSKEDWKVWRIIYPHEGFIGTMLFLALITLTIHFTVLFGTDRYIGALIGGA